jgi:hypothetical protein
MAQFEYLKKISLVVANNAGAGIDLSNLRIKFEVTKGDVQTPNATQITVYNLSEDTVSRVQKEFTQVILQAGYESNFGVIFKGTIKQVTVGKENGTDTYITIAAGDGDIAYNSAVINTTLAAGSSLNDQLAAALSPLYASDITQGYIADLGGQKLPRGKVMYGASRDHLRQITQYSKSSWSIQDGKAQVLTNTEVLPGSAFVLNSLTGLIGAPTITTDGLKGRCLLNPQLKIGSAVQIAEKDIQTAQTDTGTTGDEGTLNATLPATSIAADGFYRVLTTTYIGDTRGNDWYTDFTALQIDSTQPSSQQVQNNG